MLRKAFVCAGGQSPEVQYTLPQSIGRQLTAPAALLKQLPPDAELPAALSIVMDGLPDSEPIPVSYNLHGANSLRIEVRCSGRSQWRSAWSANVGK